MQVSEDILKRKCVKICKEFSQKENPDFWFYCPTDRFVAGIPDIIMCYKGLWGATELKTPTGKVTQLQEHTIKKLNESGAVCSVIRNTQGFHDFLQQLKQKKGGEINERSSQN